MSTMPRNYGQKAIRPDLTVRQVAADFPASRTLFRQYGEPDRRGPRFGHLEPLTHFARRHGIVLDELLSELANVTGIPVEARSGYPERVHHGFLLAALLVTLSLGAGWGAWLLGHIGGQADFGAVPAAHVIAHGEAQLWGFIGLFIMGISLRTVLQAVPRHTLGRWACRGLLALGLLGVVGSFAWFLLPDALAWLGTASGVALLLMSVSYWAMQLGTLGGKWRPTWARAVLVSGGWLVVWATVTVYLRTLVGNTGPGAYTNSQRLLLIELAVFGFAMNSIYGFGQMLLPGLLRTGSTRGWAIELAHWAHNMGTIVICLATGLAWSGLVTTAGSALVGLGAALFAVGNRGFVGRRRTSNRAEQGHAPLDLYAPLAFFWLIASLVLMTGGLLFETVSQRPLPHAYMGAVRHALTVGFMTTLILGVGQRLLPVLDRTVLALPRLAIPILLLIGAGNLLRVGSELAILATPAAFPWMPLSGVMEWCALVLFAATAVATMYHSDPLVSRGRVSKKSSLAVLLAEHPWLEDRLISSGSDYLGRTRSVPPELTIGSFAESEGQGADELVTRVNELLGEARSRSRPT